MPAAPRSSRRGSSSDGRRPASSAADASRSRGRISAICFLLEGLARQGQGFGMTDARNVVPDRWLEEGDEVTVDEHAFGVLHCPGHTPGHLVFVSRSAPFALVGDVLFRGSIGRTDFPYGDHHALLRAIARQAACRSATTSPSSAATDRARRSGPSAAATPSCAPDDARQSEPAQCAAAEDARATSSRRSRASAASQTCPTPTGRS